MGNTESSCDLSNKMLQTLSIDDKRLISKAAYLNLSHNNIIRLPTNLNLVEGISLQSNMLYKLSDDMIATLASYKKLNSLDISENRLLCYHDFFSDIKGLHNLNLSKNSIKSMKISNENIENLNISHNLFTEIPSNVPSSLRILNMNFNMIASLKSLNETIIELHLQMNKISFVAESVSFPSLIFLDISKNEIESFPDFTKIAPKIETLDISSNLLKELPKLPDTIITLNAEDNLIEEIKELACCYPKLKNVNLSHNKIARLCRFPASIELLIVNHNHISSCDDAEYPNMAKLFLNFNELLHVPLFSYPKLIDFSISHNLISDITTLSFPQTVKRIDLSHNFLNIIPSHIFNLKNLIKLNLISNKIEEIDSSLLESNLKELFLSNNLLSELPSLPQSLTKLIVGDCKLKSLPNTIVNNKNLKEIFISNNFLTKVPLIPNIDVFRASCNQFHRFPLFQRNIKVIDLSNNFIKALPVDFLFPQLFDLDMSFNNLHKLPLKILQCSELQYLNLSRNEFYQGKASFKSLKKLVMLNLEGTIDMDVSFSRSVRSFIDSSDRYDPSFIITHVDIDNNHISAIAEMRGQRERMEDSFVIIHGEISTFGIFDGHGGDVAAKVSSYCYYDYFKENAEMSEMFIVDSVNHIVEKLQEIKTIAGTTAAIALVANRQLIMAHIGDARILVINNHGKVKFETKDHKPSERNERNRIKSAGGFVSTNRVGGILSTSRSVGDFDLLGMSYMPDIAKLDIADDDRWLILGCDGVFDMLQTKEISDISLREKNAEDLACSIRNAAYGSLSTDNISVIVVDLHKING
ncbi:protein phosphatase 2C [Tritrichomonas foetus]|uniref:Protein phosphatase 2C n=1 Tax=Tritrichomonas foetus TaxID=1144522 RepID=A0A1J4K9L5_9EUKA|nr:protein phosphatase 2C [Tritrichomonas foetus]|eukprot:OHT07608.1 protein phosphatase 2C [Tritrichomonas foetus]